MKNRSFLREIVMKVLYQMYILEDAKLPVDIDELLKEQLEMENEFASSLIKGIKEKQEELINLADTYMKDWKLNRLNKVDKAIFSLGIYELLYTDTPSIVAINEALELSKKYSDEKVTKMLNGVLDSIYHNEDHHA